jgi:carbonic anhydrase
MFFRIVALSAALLGAFTADAAGGSGWDYDHVELWADMPGSACAGRSNSPIALHTSECTAPQVDYKFEKGTCTIDDFKFYVTKNGVQMDVVNTSGCTNPMVKIPNISPKYQHLQTHIHLSSEHSIDGGFFGAEMHMVHGRIGGDDSYKAYAVVGTMITPTATANNPMFEAWLQRWIQFMNTEACESCWETANVQPYEMMNVYQPFVGKDFYHFNGGLTTPPCTEAVAWNFTTDPLAISVRQFQILTELILATRTIDAGECKDITVAAKSGSTSRPPQPLNGRNVVKYCSFS